MGTDESPANDVAGGVLAAREAGHGIVLVGSERAIKAELAKHKTAGLKIDVVDAPDVITMEDKPANVGKSKPNSSMHVGMNLVRDGQADGFVTAGNTGAAQAIAMLYSLKRIRGVKRPALSAIFPINRQPLILLDVGANADSRPDWLHQFALMGEIYARRVLRLERPRVGILSNGEEEGKGSQLTQESAQLIRTLPINFVGNVEPKDIMHSAVDVLVSDGFTGNILIKTFEASTRYLANILRDELKANPINAVGGLLARSAFDRARGRIDSFEVGGAPLLGVNGVVIIGHGRSNAVAIKNAANQAARAVEAGMIQAIEAGLEAIAGTSEIVERS
jgi:glycerol-3-phosphate acyltransferase PlsX